MRYVVCITVLFMTLIGLTGCQGVKKRSVTTVKDTVASEEESKWVATHNASDSALATLSRSQLLELNENVNLAEWRRNNPGDSVSAFSERRSMPIESSYGNWCMLSQRQFVLPDGKRVYRSAFFYDPMPPARLHVANLADSLKTRMTDPILGLIWLQVNGTSAAYLSRLANLFRDSFSATLGPGKRDAQLFWYGSAGWGNTCRWQVGQKIFASASIPPITGDEEGCAAAFGILPVSDVHVDLDYKEFSIGGPPLFEDSVVFVRALGLLGQYRQYAGRLTNIYSNSLGWESNYTQGQDSANSPTIISVFREWIMLGKDAPNQERAAMLLLADLVLNRFSGFLDSSSARKLGEAGAVVAESRTNGWIYERSWLKQAWAIDHAGQAGELAFLVMLENGFQLDADCHDCGQCFGRVILEGEKYLAHCSNPQYREWANLDLGYAYSDDVAITSGYPSLAQQDSPIHVNADTARAEALDHFRQVFAYDTSSGNARRAWRWAWRLSAGIPPWRTTFTCADE